MGEVDFPVRFIVDGHFIQDLLKDKLLATKIILKISEIHKNSKHYPMEHNLISDECFMEIIKGDKEVRRAGVLLGAFHSEPWPNFVSNETDMESKMIRWAINVATKKPYVIIILTSEAKLKDYQENKHYSNGKVKSAVKISSGQEALQIIDIVSRT